MNDDYDPSQEELDMIAAAEDLIASTPPEKVVRVINTTDMPHSMGGRLAGPGTEFKLYGRSVQHLAEQFKELAEHPDLPLAIQTIKQRYAEMPKQ